MKSVLIITGEGSTPDLDYAVYRMREEQFKVTVAAPHKKRLNVVFHQQESGYDTYLEQPWYRMNSDASFDEIDPSEYDGLLLPGGRAPEHLRNLEPCIRLVRHFVENNKPIAAICRGPLILLEAGIKGKRLTGNSLIKPSIAARGSTYIDAREEPVIDGNIVTVSGRPYYHVWIRSFLSMLRPTYSVRQSGGDKNRILILIAEASSAGHWDHAYFRMLEEGFSVTTAAPVKKPVRTVVHMGGGLDGTWLETHQELPGLIVLPDASLDEIDPSEFAALIVPGARGPEHLRVDNRCAKIVRHFLDNDKPMTFICHSTNLLSDALVSAGVKGKRLMSTDGVKADVLAAGCEWIYSPGEAVTDGNIVTAWRRPDHDVWMRAFMALLEKRGIAPPKE